MLSLDQLESRSVFLSNLQHLQPLICLVQLDQKFFILLWHENLVIALGNHLRDVDMMRGFGVEYTPAPLVKRSCNS